MVPGMPCGRLARIVNWRYTEAGSRDLRLDLLRGFAVFAMAVDHVGGNSPFHVLSGGNRFFVSAAEAFVFISGVTVGVVYFRRAACESMRQVCSRAWGRAWTLYSISVWLALAFAGAAAVSGIPKGAPFSADPARFVRDVVTLQRTYYLVEVMLLYAFLMVLVPPVMWLLRRGRWPVVLATSLSLWTAYQLWPEKVVLPWAIIDYRNFPLAAWQLLFFSGLLLGYYRDRIERSVRRFPHLQLPGGWFLPSAALFALLIWAHVTNGSVLDSVAGAGAGARLLDAWFDKTTLPLPRLLACIVVFGFAWQLVTLLWRPLHGLAGPFLLTFGHSTLYAYSAHVVAVCAVEIAVFHTHGVAALTQPESFALQALALVAIWSATRVHLLQGSVQWLGRAPIVALDQSWHWRPAPSMLAAGILLGAAGLGNIGQSSIGSVTLAAGNSDTRREAYNNPVTTVTPPRASLRASASPTAVAQPLPTTSAGSIATGPTAASSQVISSTVLGPGRDSAPVAPEFAVVAGTLTEAALYSPALGMVMPYAVYLPPAYATEPYRRFPVVYMLHGAGGRYTEWSVYGLPKKAAEMMAAGELDQMIIVMPEGGRGYWANGLTGDGENWADYVIQDLVPLVDGEYRTVPTASQRAIGGLSRGGFGALYLAFTHPNVFSIVGADSPSLPSFSGLEDGLVSSDDFLRYDPIEIAGRLDTSSAPGIWLDVGNADDWGPAVETLDAILTARGISHAFSVGEGGHVQEYWISRMPEYLQFYSDSFRAAAALEP